MRVDVMVSGGAVLCRSETEIRGRVEGSGGKRVFQKGTGDLRGVVVKVVACG